MLKIGITGGIGSGKTTVCRLFETLGIPVYYADDRAKWLMQNDEELVQGLKNLFGEKVYDKNNNLNRKHLASIIFHDNAKLKALEALVHPKVYVDGMEWHEAQKNVPYTLKEAALLFEAGSYKAMDKTITVFAPIEMRIQRVMKRDNAPREAVLARINKQWPDEKKIELADFVIKNDLETGLIQQVYHLHHTFLELNNKEQHS